MKVNKSTEWIEMAEYDIVSAKVMLKGGRYLYVGFLCHLSVEKMLKAIIAKDGTTPRKTHTLALLEELAGLQDTLTVEQKTLLAELQPLNIEARYSAYKDRIAAVLTEDYCRDIVKRTEAFLAWIKQLL